MELHRGTIELQSTLGRGTRATIIFPPDRAVLEPALTRPQPAV
jgi:signal transduction histidine kinase